MVTPRKPDETDADYMRRLAAEDGVRHTVALALVVDGKFVETVVFDERPATVRMERTPNGIVAVAFSIGDDGEPPWHYVRAAGGGYEGAHTHVWRKIPDGRPGKSERAWRLVHAVDWQP
jgi:hypothetical protein